MRLIDIKRAINIAKENFEYTTSNSNGVYYIRNIQQLKISISELVKTGILADEDPFYQEILNTTSNVLSSDVNGYNRRAALLYNIGFLLENIHSWINNYVPYNQDEETTINIKLPNVLSLDQLANTTESLEKSLSYITYLYGGDPIKVQQLDHGSLWVIISVCSIQIVKALGKAISFAYDIAERHVNLQKSKEDLRLSRVKGDMIEAFAEMQKIAITNHIHDAAKEINKDLKKEEKDNERIAKLELSIRKLTDLIVTGTEFYPALTASQEIVQDFPKLYKNIESSNLSGLISDEKEKPESN